MARMIHEHLSLGDKVSDFVSNLVGSWRFKIVQSIIITIWVGFNVWGYFYAKWDPYPFILLNLFLSFQAAYTAPIIMMSQNRMEDKDRKRAIKDYETDIRAEHEIQKLRAEVEELNKKIDRLLRK